MPDPTDLVLMRAALEEARHGVGRTSPNPAVGAVVARGGEILARGWHRAAGRPHAEIEALRALDDPARARGATLYVTLEPCSTHGRTPPCTAAIIEHGLGRVVYGATDPNPSHAGAARRVLRSAGIAVTAGVLAAECTALNRPFNKWITTGVPWVTAKAALSLDGRLARPPGGAQWLTSPAARQHAQGLRARVDAILVGAGTVLADDPRLTVRGIPGARQPWRVVLAGRRALPDGARLFIDDHRDRTLVFRRQSLRAVLRALGRRQVTHAMIEGGGRVLGRAFAAGLVDAVQLYYAPLLVGGPAVISWPGRAGLRLSAPEWEAVGPDLCLKAEVLRE